MDTRENGRFSEIRWNYAYMSQWHRAVQFCAAALVGHYDDPERRASHHRVLYLRQRDRKSVV